MNRSDLPLCEITLIQRVPFLLDPKTQECTHYTLSPSHVEWEFQHLRVIVCSHKPLSHHFLSDQTANMRRYMARALMAPAMGTVPTQARMMFLKSFQSTFCLDLTRPTDTTEPTLQWVVLIGIPTLDARRTVKAEPTSMQNPLKTKHNFVIINWSLPRA